MTVLGLDIGGANIKAADDTGHAVTKPFAIWREKNRLGAVLGSLVVQFPSVSQIAVTMTAELADCFSTKAEGVRFILETVEACAQQIFSGGVPDQIHGESVPPSVIVWSTEGRFISSRNACDFVSKIASANWHALASWSGRFAPDGVALLVDIGSTTTDIIPLLNGRPSPAGLTDLARLQSGELSYSGAWRTPLCAVAHSVPFRDGYCSIASELFATMLDVYLLLNQIPEDESNFETANGRPATKQNAYDRIARMLCCDRHEVTFDEAVEVAKFLADVQRQRLAGSLEKVAHRLRSACETIIVSGSGAFLARRLISENRHTTNAKVILLADQLSSEINDAACAYAVAQLAAQEI